MTTYTAFRYRGNKRRLLKYYKDPTEDITRIVEPFSGSLAYSLKYDLPILGIELNSRLTDIYEWLKNSSEYELRGLLAWYEKQPEKFDVRLIDKPSYIKDFLSLNCGSLMTGNLDKNIIYRHAKNLPINNTLRVLDKIKKNLTIINGEFDSVPLEPTDLIFLDPPYYGERSDEVFLDRVKRFVDIYSKLGNKIIFTYDNAEAFPDYDWEEITKVTVSKSRIKTQYRTRSEYVAYFNW